MVSRYVPLAIFLLLVVLVATFAATFEAGEWYYALVKPAWTPPPWVFGPAWSLLYLLMAVAMWKVWQTGNPVRTGALIWWLLQLAFNAAWSWLFFGLNRIGWALGEMAVMIGLVVLCTRAFGNVSRTAGWLMVPYLAWLAFAFALNFSIWTLNGGGFGSLGG
jgi:tryptophan-rich sensory protein